MAHGGSDGEASRAPAGSHDGGSVLLDFLFAVLFAACFMVVLANAGFVSHPDARCQAESATGEDEGYTWCSVWQDCRSILSFVLGALVCWLCEGLLRPREAQPRDAAEADGAGRGKAAGRKTGAGHVKRLYC